MEREFADILKQIGCTDGLHVPVANEENRRLQDEVEEKLRRKADLIIKLEVQDEQLSRIQNQIQNLKAQKEQNQQLIVAHRNQGETELTLLRESEAELSRTQQQIRHTSKLVQQSQHRQQLLQDEIARSLQKLEQVKAGVEWGEEARRAWQEELCAAQRDNNVLQHFKLEDDAKFKEMELKRQRLKGDVTEREAILSNELNVLATLEHQLEQVSRLFRRAHNERMSLISYWENAVRILHQRDSNIDSTLHEIQDLKELAREKFTLLAEERKFYDSQVENNEELCRQLEDLNSKCVAQRNINSDLTDTTTDLKSEVATLRGVVSELGSSVGRERSHNSHLSGLLQSREVQLRSLHAPVQELRGRLKELSDVDLTTAQRTKEIDNILQVSEKNNSVMLMKVEKLQEKVFEKTNELENLRDTSKLMMGELKIFQVNKEAFEKRAAEIDKEVIHKEQMLYGLDMELVTLESKLARVQGERTDEEKVAFKMRVLDLEDILRKKTDLLNVVTAQYNKSKNEQGRLSVEVDKEAELLSHLTETRKELLFLVEGGAKQLSSLQASNKQIQVTVNVLQLRLDQRARALARHDNKVFSLEREKLELENALRERKIEIVLQMDLMSAKKRSLQEERSEQKKALEHFHIRVNQLQKKYDIVMDTLGKEDTGENFSVAHFKIKLAQERHELQEIGDDLDSKIKKAENEIPAMENTLRVISAANDCYKRNLDSIDSNSPEMQEKKRLEDQLENAKTNLKERQVDLKETNANIHELEMSLSELVECEERVKAEWKEKDVAARALDKELEEQQTKLLRADKLLNKVKKESRQVKESRIPLHLAEKDIELRELQDINQSALQQLAELGTRYAEVGPLLSRYLGEKGLKLPLVRSTLYIGRNKIPGSTVTTQRSLISEDSHMSWSSVPSSQSASIVTLDIDAIHPAGRRSADGKHQRVSGSRKKSK